MRGALTLARKDTGTTANSSTQDNPLNFYVPLLELDAAATTLDRVYATSAITERKKAASASPSEMQTPVGLCDTSTSPLMMFSFTSSNAF